jgi:kinetochore protein Spc25, fungi type
LREEEKSRLSKMELTDFQKYLGLQIIPLPNNQTRFSFLQIDPKAPNDTLCSFVVDVSQEQYRVLSCEPMIPDMGKIVDDLNQHRDFYRFLKLCRQRFVALHQ